MGISYPGRGGWSSGTTAGGGGGGGGGGGASSRPQSDRNFTVAAEGEIIPIVYGLAQVKANVALLHSSNGSLLTLLIWAQGEINKIADIAWGSSQDAPSVTWTHYTGKADQLPDPTIVAAIPSYTDNLVVTEYAENFGVAYSVGVMTQPKQFKVMSATVEGRLVYDPRQDKWVYSDNAALCLADFLSNKTFGMGFDLDWQSVTHAADFNDDAMADGDIRARCSLVLDRQARAENWAETLRELAQVYLSKRGGKWRMIPDRARLTDFTVDPSHFLGGSLKLWRPGADALPNVVRTKYLQTGDIKEIWKERTLNPAIKAPNVGQPNVPWREKTLSTSGIPNKSQALRIAIQHLNRALLCDLSCRVVLVGERAARVDIGDVIEITEHEMGLSGKRFRVEEMDDLSAGVVEITCSEYNPAVYSNEVSAGSSEPDTNLPSPQNIPVIENLTLTENIYRVQNAGAWLSRIITVWQEPLNYPFNLAYEVIITDLEAGQIVESAYVYATEFVSPPLTDFKQYQVDVRGIAVSYGSQGQWVGALITLDGKKWPPSNVPHLEAFEAGGTVFLRWSPATDRDVSGYQWGYCAQGILDTNDAWNHPSFTLINVIDSLHDSSNALPTGQWDILIRAVDSVGNVSAIPTRVGVVVTLDDNYYNAGVHHFTDPNLLNMCRISLLQESTVVYAPTSIDVVDQSAPLLCSAYDGILACMIDGGSREVLTNVWDIGSLTSGEWRANVTAIALVGSISSSLELSANNIDYTSYPALSARVGAQYARIRVNANASSGFLLLIPQLSASIKAAARLIRGSGTTDSDGFCLVDTGQAIVQINSFTIYPHASADSYVDILTMHPTLTFRVTLLTPRVATPVASFFNYVFDVM